MRDRFLASAISPHMTFTWRKVGAVVMISDSGHRASAHDADRRGVVRLAGGVAGLHGRQRVGRNRPQDFLLDAPWVLARIRRAKTMGSRFASITREPGWDRRRIFSRRQ